MNKLTKIVVWVGMSLFMQSRSILGMDEIYPEVQNLRDQLTTQRAGRQSVDNSIIREEIPSIALGHEDIYERFINGRLFYEDREIAKIKNIINHDSLEGTFDLSLCGNAVQYLSIHAGYRKRKNPANANKVEIWFVPRFLVEKELDTTAVHLRPIMNKWTAPVGTFWNWGEWDDLVSYDYLVSEEFSNFSDGNLYEKWRSPHTAGLAYSPPYAYYNTIYWNGCVDYTADHVTNKCKPEFEKFKFILQ